MIAPDAADQPIRDAATVILARALPRGGHAVLMGQRGAGAAFMPSKFVFPGGAVDAADAGVPLAGALSPVCAARLTLHTGPGAPAPATLAATAVRELWEETGLALARPAAFPTPPEPWAPLAARGLAPDASALRFVFRAITPPGRTRRFDARFFLADAAALADDPDDLGKAADELSHLRWVPLAEARALDLPFITEIVLAEIAHVLAERSDDAGVPFFDNSTAEPTFRRLNAA
jgi:8-oxo-dGTP pyrophosphatase MutT (NUDIX family)